MGTIALAAAALAATQPTLERWLAVQLDPRAAAAWSEEEVLELWCQLFSRPLLVQRLRAGKRLSEAERRRVSEWPEINRDRFCDLSEKNLFF